MSAQQPTLTSSRTVDSVPECPAYSFNPVFDSSPYLCKLAVSFSRTRIRPSCLLSLYLESLVMVGLSLLVLALAAD